jgi:hypothetical protein
MTDATPLSQLIRLVTESDESGDPRRIAQRVADLAPPEQLREYLAVALVGAVRTTLVQRRNTAIHQVNRVAQGAASAKLAQRRDWWACLLAAPVNVAGGWKTVGDCTTLDLRHAETHRRELAAQTLRHADFYRLLRTLLTEHRVDTVAELPAAAVSRIRWAAA